MTIRIVRALIGLFALIMLKASLQPGFDYFVEGDSASFVTFAWRFLTSVAAFVAFFRIRTNINQAYIARGSAAAPLRSVWSL
jgi:hypothetical protein